MQINFLIGISENPPGADKSAVGAINRPLRVAGLIRQCASSCSSPIMRFNKGIGLTTVVAASPPDTAPVVAHTVAVKAGNRPVRLPGKLPVPEAVVDILAR